MKETGEFHRIAVVGAGFIGASFGLAAERACPGISIVAYDRPEVLAKARSKFGWEISEELGEAVSDADLVYIALPVVAAAEMLPLISARCGAGALITDTGSTKLEICKVASVSFAGTARFIGGHPIAGKELNGLERADATLFQKTRYVLIGNESEEESEARIRKFTELVRAIGAKPVWSDAETHDWAMAVVSHMPQLVAIALARVIADETDESGLPVSLAGTGLRDMLRIAGSRYEMWRDICLTNSKNIGRSLDRMAQAIDFLRRGLVSEELEQEFHRANEVYEMLCNMR